MAYAKATIVSIAVAVSAFCAPVVHAANWIEISNPSTTGFTVGADSFTYGPVTASDVWIYDGSNPPGSQSPAAIGSLVTTMFSLPGMGAGSLVLSSYGDLSSSKSGSFTVDSSYSYLAIHYGKGELLFHWDQPVAANTVFAFDNLPRGISNYRAFSSVSPVPEPSTYGMLLGGLALMGLLARRRARK